MTPATPLTPLQVELATGHVQEFDAVILATHSDTSLKILGQNAPQVSSLQQISYISPEAPSKPGLGKLRKTGLSEELAW